MAADSGFSLPSYSFPSKEKIKVPEVPLTPPDHAPSMDYGNAPWMMREPWASVPFATRPAPVTSQYNNRFYHPMPSNSSRALKGVRAMAGPGMAQLSNLVDKRDWGSLTNRGFRGYREYYIVLSGWVMNFWDNETLPIVLTSHPTRPYCPVAWLDMRSARQAYCEKSLSLGVDAAWLVSICFQDGVFQFRVDLQEDAELWVQTIMETIIACGVQRMTAESSWVPNISWAGDFYQGPDQEASGASWLVSRDGRWVEGDRHWAPYATMADGHTAALAFTDDVDDAGANVRTELSKVEELAAGGGFAPQNPAGRPALRPVQPGLLDQYATGGSAGTHHFHGAGKRTKSLRRIWGDAVRCVAAGQLIAGDSMVALFALYDQDSNNNLSTTELEGMCTELLTVRRDELQYTLQRETMQHRASPFGSEPGDTEEMQHLAVRLSKMYEKQLQPSELLKRVVYAREALDFNHNRVVNVDEFVRMAPHVLFPREELKLEADFYSLCDVDPEAEIDIDSGGCMTQ